MIAGRTPKWAQLKSEDGERKRKRAESPAAEDDDEEQGTLEALEEMTRSTGKYITKSRTLPKHRLDAALLKDVTVGHNANGSIQAVRFHPSKPVLVTGSGGGVISLFELAEDANELALKKGDYFLQDAKFEKFYLDALEFCNDGLSLLAHATNKRFCYVYDLLEGKVSQVFPPKVLRDLRSSKMAVSKDGVLVAHIMGGSDLFVFTLSTMEHVHTFRAGAKLVDALFCPTDRNIIYALAENGAVYVWELRRKSEQASFFDDGCVRATCLAASANGQFIACGSNTGIVNVYESSTALSGLPARAEGQEADGEAYRINGEARAAKPLYTLSNLTTSALFLAFNHDAQMMAFGSSVKHMAGRMLHCRSGTVFQNFPARQEMFAKERVKCAEFSPGGGLFAFGSESGACRLYRLKHFDGY